MLDTLKIIAQLEKSLPTLFAEMKDEQAAMKPLRCFIVQHVPILCPVGKVA